MTNTGQYLRRKGFTNTIQSDFPKIKIVEIVEEFRDPDKTYQSAISVIKKYPDLRAIYISEGNTPYSAAKAIKELGKSDSIKIFTHDITEKTVEYIEDGIIACSLSQNPYAQGYNPVILLYNYLMTREEPVIRRILTQLEEVTKDNVSLHWKKNEGQSITDIARNSLVLPVENILKKPVKIAVILPGDIKGVCDASDLMKKYNVEVIIKIPESIRKGDFSAACFIKALEPLVDERCNAIALPLFDPALVEHLNKLVESGISIATLNSEQINFRGMLDTVSNHTKQLFSVSENLAASSTETYHATIQISNTMSGISENSMKQIDKIIETNANMGNLIETINAICSKSEENLKSVENASAMALAGSRIVNESDLALDEVRRNADSSTSVIRQLNENARKIGDITTIINELAGKTKLIAVNASILAARAGDEGKGFSVLAEEIRNLSDRSNTSTRDISLLIEDILKSVNNVTQMVAMEMDGIRTITEFAKKSENALDNIKQATDESKQKSQIILHSVKDMEDFSMKVKKSMNELIEMNKANADSIQEISYSTNEMNQEVHENSNLALRLSKLAQSQEDIVSLFMISEEKS
jgi:methyl-accepting chemotaxis protein